MRRQRLAVFKDDQERLLGDNANFDLGRFVTAQSSIYDTALAEVRARRKQSHWMWFIFPQLKGLGTSDAAVYYAISGIDEAKAYMAHTVLGPRLIECTLAMCDGTETDARTILGEIDMAKFRSCMTLFELADRQQLCFVNALDKFFDSVRDDRTSHALNRSSI